MKYKNKHALSRNMCKKNIFVILKSDVCLTVHRQKRNINILRNNYFLFFFCGSALKKICLLSFNLLQKIRYMQSLPTVKGTATKGFFCCIHRKMKAKTLTIGGFLLFGQFTLEKCYIFVIFCCCFICLSPLFSNIGASWFWLIDYLSLEIENNHISFWTSNL